MAIAIGITLIIGGLIGLVAIVNSNANKREEQQAFLDDYTSRIRSLSAFVATPVNEMTRVNTVPTGEALEQLERSATGWVSTFEEAEGRLSAIGPTVGPPGVFDLLNQAIALYSSSAKTLKLLPEANEEIRADLFGRAVDQKDRAEAIWTQGVSALDRGRDDVGMDPSGLGSPGTSLPAQPPIPPSPLVSPSIDTGGNGGGQNGGGQNGGGQNNGGGKDE